MVLIPNVTVRPKLKIAPGSIHGPGGDVDITFTATVSSCYLLGVEYRITGTRYKFTGGGPATTRHTAAQIDPTGVASMLHFGFTPGTSSFSSGKLTMSREGDDRGDAALGISMKVVNADGPGGSTGPYTPVRGRVAILSRGLREVLKAEFDVSRFIEGDVTKYAKLLKKKFPRFGSVDLIKKVLQGKAGSGSLSPESLRDFGSVVENYLPAEQDS